jgi:peptide/nickel transport system substrate-binding protein
MANDVDAHVFGFDGGINPIVDNWAYIPYPGNATAQAYGLWYTGVPSELAEEPTGDMRKVYDLFDELKSTPDHDQQLEIMAEILQLHADNFWQIGISSQGDGYGVRKNNFMNVADPMIAGWNFPSPAPYHTYTYYFDTE